MKYSGNSKVYGIRYFNVWFYLFAETEMDGKGQILRSTPNTAPLICGAYNTQPEGLSTMA